MPLLSIGERQLYYAGPPAPGNQPALVFIHGAGCSGADWPYQWQQPATPIHPKNPRWITDYPRYFLDLPGHGRSPGPAPTSVDGYTADVAAFIQAANISQAILVGHSMGAAIGLALALLQPPRLAGLVLLGGGPAMPVSQPILDGLTGNFVQTVGLIMKFSWNKGARSLDREVATQHMLSAGAETVWGDFAACNAFDVSDRLGEIRVPSLIVGGVLDRMMPLHQSEMLVKGIPGAGLAVIDEAGHYMHVEQTNQVNRELLPFLHELG